MIGSNREWGFCRVVNYTRDGSDNIKLVSQKAHPQDMKVYINGNDDKCRWNYIAFDDLITGAAMLCKKQLLVDYLNIIKGRITYAEDNIFRMMMFDGVVPYFFSADVVLYEYGDGVSTSGSSLWERKLRDDWDAADQIMINQIETKDNLQKKMKNILVRKRNMPRKIGTFFSFFDKGRFIKTIRNKLFVNKTSITIDKSLLNQYSN
jgi:hypothetical protein